MKLTFKENTQSLTLGAELEFQILDNSSLQLTPRAAEIIKVANTKKIIREFFQSTVEVVTGVCENASSMDRDFTDSIRKIREVAHLLEIQLASTGTHPMADYRERIVTDSARYKELVARNQWLVLRRAVYGMHIHLGMKTGDECITYNNFFLHFVPHLIALSASSPFWQKYNTGLSACRLTMYEAMPTAGIPYLVKSWSEFQKLIKFLRRSDSIRSMKDLWWDLRPSPALGTLELRMFDAPASYHEAMGIIALVHALALWFRDHREEWIKTTPSLKHWIYRENKWRAIRYGLEASIIISRTGQTELLKEDLERWIIKLQPYIQSMKYEKYVDIIPKIIGKGNSSERQRKVFEQSGDLMTVIRHNIMEFEQGNPIWN